MINVFSSGGIGDQIMALSWLEQFAVDMHQMPISLYTNYPEIVSLFNNRLRIVDNRTARRPNDYIIYLNDFVEFKFSALSGRSLLPPVLHDMYDARQRIDAEWGDLIRAEPHRANEMARLAVNQGLRRWTLPFHCVGQQPRRFMWDCEGIPETFRFITVHDGFDKHLNFDVSMKSWPMEHWAAFVKQFKNAFPDIRIIQLGTAKSRPIPGVDQNLCGALSFAFSMRYLKSSLVHVDGDSGLVHARRLFNQPSVVMFGPTNYEYFGYPENINHGPRYCGNCWWTKSTWMKDCVKGHPTALCMDSVRPEDVLRSVEVLINAKC